MWPVNWIPVPAATNPSDPGAVSRTLAVSHYGILIWLELSSLTAGKGITLSVEREDCLVKVR